MSEISQIAIIGVGNVGGNLGVRLAHSGFPLRFGVKPDKDIHDLLARCDGKAKATSVAEAAAWADVIFLAVPYTAVVEVAKSAGDLKGKVLVDCSNPVAMSGTGPTLVANPAGSVTAMLAKAVPTARVVKAFNTFGAEFHLDPMIGGIPADVYMAGDDAAAKATVASIANRAGFAAIDAGPLRNAALLESLAILWIHLASKGNQGRHIAFKLLKRG
jgi:NADPH-dependent F420 reductase